jgi:hypothetical protein
LPLTLSISDTFIEHLLRNFYRQLGVSM